MKKIIVMMIVGVLCLGQSSEAQVNRNTQQRDTSIYNNENSRYGTDSLRYRTDSLRSPRYNNNRNMRQNENNRGGSIADTMNRGIKR